MAKKTTQAVSSTIKLIAFAMLMLLIGLGWIYFSNYGGGLLGNSVRGNRFDKEIQQATDLSPTITQSLEYYSNDVLDFKVILPSGFNVESQSVSVALENSIGTIRILRSASLYDNLEEHITDQRVNIKTRLSMMERLSIDGNEAVRGYFDDEKTYIVQINGLVYSFSTSSPELYDELDQIAQSFEYLGEE